MKCEYIFLGLLSSAFVLQLFNTFLSLAPFLGIEFLKAMFPLLLLVASLVDSAPTPVVQIWLYRVGLLFTALGDYFLGIPNTPFFLAGMGAFGIGYLLYALTTRPKASLPLAFLITASLSGIQFVNLKLDEPFMTGVLFIYMLIITYLLAGGWSQWIDCRTTRYLLMALGFTFIYISDSMIGHTEFGHIVFGQIPILLTYNFGQTLVALSFWRHLRDS